MSGTIRLWTISKRQFEVGVDICFSNNERLGGPKNALRSPEVAEEIDSSPEQAIRIKGNANSNLEAETPKFEYYKNLIYSLQILHFQMVIIHSAVTWMLLNMRNITIKNALFEIFPQFLDELQVFLKIFNSFWRVISNYHPNKFTEKLLQI
ncbi:hypothetical protein JTB14_014718 [Gonioctena quinquepunctata]|nr:hypothetical protein JTB14_014718 [Gonioctena quinquepunctata]